MAGYATLPVLAILPEEHKASLSIHNKGRRASVKITSNSYPASHKEVVEDAVKGAYVRTLQHYDKECGRHFIGASASREFVLAGPPACARRSLPAAGRPDVGGTGALAFASLNGTGAPAPMFLAPPPAPNPAALAYAARRLAASAAAAASPPPPSLETLSCSTAEEESPSPPSA